MFNLMSKLSGDKCVVGWFLSIDDSVASATLVEDTVSELLNELCLAL